MSRVLTPAQAAESSIQKQFRKYIWAPFLEAIRQYELIESGDRIAVCISGGKDSFLMAKLFQLHRKMSGIEYEPVFLCMDPGYSEETRQLILDNAVRLDIPVRMFRSDIFDIIRTAGNKRCFLCSRMRRGCLYGKAQELSCNKIALGHHLNDAVETVLMSMFYSSKLETMIPKCISENHEGMSLIRPMYRIKEEAVSDWCSLNDLSFIQCACPVTAEKDGSARSRVKELVSELKKDNPEIEDNIFRALHAVQLDSFPGYKTKGELHSFTEEYSRGNGSGTDCGE